jgi:spore coat protein H
MRGFPVRRSQWLGVIAVLAASITHAQTTADFFDDSIMQEVRLQVDSGVWATLQQHYLENTYYPAQFTWRGITLNIGIRSRGSGSRSPVKPNLLLKFDKYVKNQKFLGEVAIVAKANNQDPSNLRERISFKLFQKMGLPAPRESFARVYLNGEYFGLYVMAEYIDEQFLKRNFGENTGYLYEWVNTQVYNFQYLGPDPEAYAQFLDLKTNQAAADLNNFVGLITAINLTPDGQLAEAVSKYLDPKIYLTHVATEDVLAEADGIVGGTFGMNNVYLYQFDGQTLYQFLPWDKDNTFDWYGWSTSSGMSDNVLTRRLLAIPEFSNTYISALARAANLFGGPGAWADLELTREYNLIAEDARRDPHKQCSIANVMQSCGELEFENAVKDARGFIAQRATFVESAVGTPPRNSQDPNIAAATARGTELSAFAPGMLATLTGTNLGGISAAPDSGTQLPRTIRNVWAAVDGVRAPLLSIAPNLIQMQIPWGIHPGASSITVAVNGALSDPVEVPVAASAPVILALTHADGSVVSPSYASQRGETLIAFAMGLGEVTPQIDIGVWTPASALVWSAAKPRVSIGGLDSQTIFAGLTPGFVGLYQVNFVVPAQCSTGTSVPLTLELNGASALMTVAVN